MNTLFSLALIIISQGDIKVEKEEVRYARYLSLDAKVIQWTIEPKEDIKVTGESTATVNALAGTYIVTAWLENNVGRTIKLFLGEQPVTELIREFSATPEIIQKGQSSVLKWSVVSTVKNVKLNGIDVSLNGEQLVAPTITTQYTLTATDGLKTSSAQRVVTVGDLPPPITMLYVVFVEDKTKRPELPAEQVAIFTSQVIRDYLESKKAQFRFFSINDDMSKEDKVWQDAMKLDHSKVNVPYVIISNGKEGILTELPETVEKTIELLKKYGG